MTKEIFDERTSVLMTYTLIADPEFRVFKEEYNYTDAYFDRIHMEE